MCEKVSIIVPVYNVELYIDECIQSILEQTYRNIEIILVDDGSTDKSGIKCDEYAKKDSRIIVLHKVNGGLAEARNYGVNYASGEWILFVDSDDYIKNNACERLIETAMKFKSDIVVGKEKKFENKLIIQNVSDNLEPECLTSEEGLIAYFYRKFNGYACGKLIKTSLVRKFPFPIGKYFEDAFVVYHYLEYSNKIVVIQDELYYYRQRSGSIVNSNFTKKQLDIIEANEICMRYFADKNKNIQKAVLSKFFVACVDVLRKMPIGKEYSNEKKKIYCYIRKFRKVVLADHNNKLVVRMLALVSCFSPQFVACLAKTRQFIKIGRV